MNISKLLELQLNIRELLKKFSTFRLFISVFSNLNYIKFTFPPAIINEIPLQCLPIIF